MKIVYLESFQTRLNRQLSYIAYDSPVNAKRFRDGLKKAIHKIKKYPYSNRRSIFFDNDDIRDLVYKGYIIVYRITEKHIEVFGFTKNQLKAIDN
ncbi:MAG: type II toxin-antitoxin system RelE/ParE family toxin [Candidatus Neomarinimicrobiota bacterium]|nr:MAG: type II toxin-antitoxin system RelE/ParE family toxin [Candidatus Neomarinimicrobiota bacterium]